MVEKFKRGLGQPQFRVAEILLPIEDADSEGDIRQLAERLHDEIENGGSFNNIAQEFRPRPAPRMAGGLAGYQPGQLSAELDGPLKAMQAGQVTQPIRTVFGYHMLKLEDRRILSAADPLKARVTLKHVFFAVASESERRGCRGATCDCRGDCLNSSELPDMDALAKEVNSPAGVDLGKFLVGELSPAMRGTVVGLEPGVASKPVRLPTGFSVIMICERVAPPSNIPTRKAISQRLRSQKLDIMARRYLPRPAP